MSSQTMENTGDALGQSIALTRQARSEFSAEISSLNGRLADIGGQWQGQGATAFIRVQSAWNDQVSRLLSALEGFSDALAGTERSFDLTDADVTTSLSQLTHRLG
jgi:WXG100 family type VII secretion target